MSDKDKFKAPKQTVRFYDCEGDQIDFTIDGSEVYAVIDDKACALDLDNVQLLHAFLEQFLKRELSEF